MLNNSRLGTGNPWLNLELLKEDMEYDGNADFNNFDVENDERTNKNNNTINLAAKDIFPALHLGKESLASLVRAIFSSSQDTPDKILDGFFCEMLGWNNNSDSCISSSLVPIYSALGAPHTLSVINTDLKTSRKNINLVPFPVTVHMVRDNGSSQLELDTRHCAISDRLTTSLKSSRRFSLRSVMGIRALAFIQQYQHHQAIQLQVECSLPDLQFTFNPISQPNILASRLSEHLAGLRAAPETTHSESLHFGYLCYTRSRKVATVLESNPNLQSVTTEGVWVRLEDDADLVVGNDADRSLLTHPLCWGACARFICSEHVNRRPGRPFLLLVFNPSRGTIRSFEVQVNNDPAANTPLAITHVSHSMNMSYQYEDVFDDGFSCTPLLCKFRHMASQSYNSVDNPAKLQVNPVNKLIEYEHRGSLARELERVTPLPRSLHELPRPFPTTRVKGISEQMMLPKRDDSFDRDGLMKTSMNNDRSRWLGEVDEHKNECDTTGSSGLIDTHCSQTNIHRSLPTIVQSSQPEASYGTDQLLVRQYKETNRAQQVQINSLTQQVSELRALVKQLMIAPHISASINKSQSSFGYKSQEDRASSVAQSETEVPSAVYMEIKANIQESQESTHLDTDTIGVPCHIEENLSECDGEFGSVNDMGSVYSGVRGSVVLDARKLIDSTYKPHDGFLSSYNRLSMRPSSLYGPKSHIHMISPRSHSFGLNHRDRITIPTEDAASNKHFYAYRGSSMSTDASTHVHEPSILESESLLLIQSRYLSHVSSGRNI